MGLIQRALEFRVSTMEALLRIAVQLSAGTHSIDPPSLPQPHDYQNREQYRLGEFSTERPADLSSMENPSSSEDNPDGQTTP
jgi:hypothetical protein